MKTPETRPPSGPTLTFRSSGEVSQAALDASQDEHRRAVAALPPLLRRAYATYLRTGRMPAPPSLAPSRRSPSRSRAPRAASTRTRGSRRGVARTSALSGDSGEPSDSDPPGLASAPPTGRDKKAERLCLAVDCDESMAGRAPQAKFCSDACRIRDDRTREERERLAAEAFSEGSEPRGPEDRFDFLRGLMERDAWGQPYFTPRRSLGHEWREANRGRAVVA